MEFEPRGIERRTAIVRERTAHGRAVAPYHFGFRGAPSFKAPFDGTDPTDTFFPCFLGMTVRVIHGLCGLTEIMEVAEVGGHCGEHCCDGTADGALAIRNDTDNRHLHALPYRLQQHGQVCLGRGQHTAGEEDFPGEAITEDPEHRMANVRLQPVERQDHPSLGLGDPLETGGVRQREAKECVVPFEQMAHGPWGDDHTTLAHVLVDFGHTAMLRVTQGTDRRYGIQAKLVLG